MLCAFVTADTALGRFDPSMLSPQDAMELLAAGLDEESQLMFQDDTAAFLDLCNWLGVICKADHSAKRIEWHTRALRSHKFFGTMNIALLPETVDSIRIIKHPVEGTIDAGTLPSALRHFDLSDCRFEGPVAFEAMPKSLIEIHLPNNALTGSIHLTDLPPKLTHLDLGNNAFSGGIDLESLPACLRLLQLKHNHLYGALSFANLPKKLNFLDVGDNNFTGSLNTDHIPRAMITLTIRGNDFTGTLNLRSVPKGCTIFRSTRSFSKEEPKHNPNLVVVQK